LYCSRTIARTVPVNYTLLTVFTLCYGYITAAIVSEYELKKVIYAIGCTLSMTISLTYYANKSGVEDFCRGMRFTSLVILTFASVFA